MELNPQVSDSDYLISLNHLSTTLCAFYLHPCNHSNHFMTWFPFVFLPANCVSQSRAAASRENCLFKFRWKVCNLLFSSSAYLDSCLLLNLTVLRASSSHFGRWTQFCHAKAGRHTWTRTCTDILFYVVRLLSGLFFFNFQYKLCKHGRWREYGCGLEINICHICCLIKNKFEEKTKILSFSCSFLGQGDTL